MLAAEITAKGGPELQVADAGDAAAAAAAHIVLLAVPFAVSFACHDDLVSSLAAELDTKIVISCVNPARLRRNGPYAVRVAAGSVAEETVELVPGAQIGGALHHVSALNLWKHEGLLTDEDVPVCGDDDHAKSGRDRTRRTKLSH